MSVVPTKAQEIIDFWFKETPIEKRFKRDEKLDASIKKFFLKDFELASTSEYDDWQDTPLGSLALVILFDQFSRNMFRDDSKAFSQDHKARLIVNDADQITKLSKENMDPWSTPLRLGIIPTLGPYLIPKFFLQLKHKIPGSKVFFDENITENLMSKLSTGELDAVLLATDVDKKKFNTLDLFEEPFWAAFHKGSNLRNIDNLKSSDLKKERMLLLHDGHCLRDQALQVCSPKDLDTEQNLDTRATSLETLINIVAAGEGFTLIPALALQSSWTTDMGIFVGKINQKNASRKIRLVYRKSFSKESLLKDLAAMITEQSPNTVKILLNN